MGSSRLFSILLATGLFLLGCDATVIETEETAYVLIAPARMAAGEPIPVVVRAVNGAETDTDRSERITLTSSLGTVGNGALNVKKGVGSATVQLDGRGTAVVGVLGDGTTRDVLVVDSLDSRSYSGTLGAEDAIWDQSIDRLIAGDLRVPAGMELVIEAGARILLGDKVNLTVDGTLTVRGTEENPVLFTSINTDAPWGGIDVRGGSADVRYAFFTNGGADASRKFGHSESQPVFMVRQGEALFSHAYLIDNVGKALAASTGRLSFDRGLISRCDTGGEFAHSRVHITRSHILDIPNDDGIFVDDDNDGFYFWEVHPSGEPSKVEHTFIITGKDDAIDHNHALLEINHSWLEDFMHEGVAGSSGNQVRIFSTVIRGCEQGIEAGYGSPTVIVDHSVVVDNKVGLRFGDSYTAGSSGKMTVTNSILHGNEDNILNFDLLLQAPVDSGIVIRQSMTNDTDFDGCDGCMTGTPRFDARYFLQPNSPGKGAGDDGSDLGLVREE